MYKALCCFLLLIWTLAGPDHCFSQVAVNKDGSEADVSAMLDVKSANSGLLVPRVNLLSVTDVTTIVAPATALLVFNTNGDILNGSGAGYYYYTGQKWSRLSSNTIHYIGESYGGGTVFWLDETGEHGLIAATSDQGVALGTQWYSGTYKVTGANADGVYAGRSNTDKILASQGSGTYAAALCRDYAYKLNNVYYNDWYLPSKYELNLMYQEQSLLAPFNYSYGIYWSSTEGAANPTNMAWEMVCPAAIGNALST